MSNPRDEVTFSGREFPRTQLRRVALVIAALRLESHGVSPPDEGEHFTVKAAFAAAGVPAEATQAEWDTLWRAINVEVRSIIYGLRDEADALETQTGSIEVRGTSIADACYWLTGKQLVDGEPLEIQLPNGRWLSGVLEPLERTQEARPIFRLTLASNEPASMLQTRFILPPRAILRRAAENKRQRALEMGFHFRETPPKPA